MQNKKQQVPNKKTALPVHPEQLSNPLNLPLELRFLDKQEVLQLLHISGSTLQKWRSSGKISYTQIGGKFFYSLKEILKILESSMKKGMFSEMVGDA